MTQSDCSRCQRISRDLLAVVELLCRLKREKMRGEVTIRLDGSGRIRSQVVHAVFEEKIPVDNRQS